MGGHRTVCFVVLLAAAGVGCRRAPLSDSGAVVAPVAVSAGTPAGRMPDASETDAAPDSGRPASVRFGTAAVHVKIEDLGLGQFVSGDPPSAEHPKGTLTVLAGRYSPEEVRDSWDKGIPTVGQDFVLSIDLATLIEIGRVFIGPALPSMLARSSTDLFVAIDDTDAIAVIWLDSALSIRARYRIPKAPAGHQIDLKGFAAIEDRLVVVVDDFDHASKDLTVAIVLDDQARVVAKHVCRGHLFDPSPPAAIDAWGHRAVLTDLQLAGKSVACAFGLDACAGTLTAEFPLSSLLVRDGTLFLETDAPGGRLESHRLGDDLRPVGPALDPKRPDRLECTAITGTATWQEAVIGGLLVTRTVSCCGDPAPSGLWVCDPAAKEAP